MFNSFFFPRSLFISLSIYQSLSTSQPPSLHCCLSPVSLHLSLSLIHTYVFNSIFLSQRKLSLTLFLFDSISLYLTTFRSFFPISLYSSLYLSFPSFLYSSLLLYIHLHHPSTSFPSVVMCFVKVRGSSLKCIAKSRVTCAVADKRCAAEVAQRKRNNILHNKNSNNNEGYTQGRSNGGGTRKVR